MAEKNKISWQAYEHNHKDKSSDWFWAVGIISVAGAVLAIYFGNMLFGLFILLASFTAILQGHSQPKLLEYEINRKGVRIGGILHPFSDMKSFCIIDEEVNDRIIFKAKAVLLPFIIIPFNSLYTETEELRTLLRNHLREEELEEPLGQKIMETFGF